MGTPGTKSLIVDALRDVVDRLNERDQKFANQLISQWDQKGWLSKNQIPWVTTLTERAHESTTGSMVPKKAEHTVIQLGDVTKLFALFERAESKHVQWPVIKFTCDKTPIRLTHGKDDKLHLNVDVKDDYGKRPWIGGVDRGGAYSMSRKNKPPQGLGKVLEDFATNPSDAGRVYGKAERSCCFCGITLRSKDSLYYGYGPICADNFGLEWGNATELTREEDLADALDEGAEMIRQFNASGGGF
jgi:hypothetical protein